jgi:plasmid stability protein
MSQMTIRNVDDDLKQRLRVRAAHNGRSMEEEARQILRHALTTEAPPPVDLGATIHRRFGALGGVELEVPAREPMRPPPDFSGGGRPARRRR